VNDTATKGPVKVGDHTVAALAANQAAMGFDEIALDFNHNSLPGHPNFKPDPRETAGYGPLEVVPGDGLYLTALSYTPSGNKFAREYRDLSPSVLLDDDGEVIFCHSVALCPQGEVRGLSFYSVNVIEALSAATAAPSSKPKNNTTMDYKKLICLILGLDPASATDTEIEAAAEKFGKEEEAEDDPENPEGEGEAEEPEEGKGEKIKALSTQVADLVKVVSGLTKVHDSSQRDAILQGATRDGKIVPMSARTLPLEDLRKIVAELPGNQVPLEQRTPENLTALAAGGALPNTQEAEIQRLLGINPAKEANK
jgi:phage I-like protein